jgi:hypothetical protein
MKKTFGTQECTYQMLIQFRELRVSLPAIMLVGVCSLIISGCKGGKAQEPQDSGVSDKSSADSTHQVKSARDFVLFLQQALRNGDRNWVLGATRYPVQVGEIAGTDQAFLNNYKNAMLDQAAFVAKYDAVWNPERVKLVIGEHLDHFNSDDNPLVFGCGEVWFDKAKDGQFKITGFDISEYRIAGMSMLDCHQVRAFLTELRAAIASDGREKVTGMIKYPLRYHSGSKTITFHSAQEVLRDYDLVFSAKLRRAITEQQDWNLIGQAEGIGIEGGFIWISSPSQNGSFKVTGIIAPP